MGNCVQNVTFSNDNGACVAVRECDVGVAEDAAPTLLSDRTCIGDGASGGLSTGAIVGVVVASVVAVVFIACCVMRNGQAPPPPAARSPWEASRQYGHGAKEVLEAEQGHEAERRPPTYRDMMSEKPARQVSEV